MPSVCLKLITTLGFVSSLEVFVLTTSDDCTILTKIYSRATTENLRCVTTSHRLLLLLKNKGPDIYIPPLIGKPEQQRFTMRSGVLTNISSRQRSAIRCRSLPKRTDFGPACLYCCTVFYCIIFSPYWCENSHIWSEAVLLRAVRRLYGSLFRTNNSILIYFLSFPGSGKCRCPLFLSMPTDDHKYTWLGGVVIRS